MTNVGYSADVLFALAASLLYGVSDFFGGVAARRIGTLTVTAVSYLGATSILAIASLIVAGTWTSAAVAAGAVAGIAAVIGFVAFYAALAAGPISLLAPGIALLQSAVPAVFGVAAVGERLHPIGWIGVATALVAGLLLGTPGDGTTGRVSVRAASFGIVSGVTLGISIVALDYAPGDSGIVPALVEVAVGLPLLAAAVLGRRVWPRMRSWAALLDSATDHASTNLIGARTGLRRRTLGLALLAGLLLGAGNGLVIVALRHDALAVVAVLIGLYPLATVLLARTVLHERLAVRQALGVALAVLGCALLGLA